MLIILRRSEHLVLAPTLPCQTGLDTYLCRGGSQFVHSSISGGEFNFADGSFSSVFVPDCLGWSGWDGHARDRSSTPWYAWCLTPASRSKLKFHLVFLQVFAKLFDQRRFRREFPLIPIDQGVKFVQGPYDFFDLLERFTSDRRRGVSRKVAETQFQHLQWCVDLIPNYH